MADELQDNKQALFELDTKSLCNGCCHQNQSTVNHVGGYHLDPSNIQPRDVTYSILYSSASFRFCAVSRIGNF